MRSLSFLLSRRWILFLATVLLLSWVAWMLGQWQFHRLDDRQESNAIIERNAHAAPMPVAEVLSPEHPLDAADEWTHVTATGTYDVASTVVVRYRTRDGVAGVNVVVPLVPASGPAVLVDRGWVATDNRGTTSADAVPDPPAGEVTVTGWVRVDAEGDSARVADQSTRAINSVNIAEALDLTAHQGFVVLDTEDPEPETPLAHSGLPEMGNGPHFFYGLQWWFFGLMAIGGFIWLTIDEVRGKKRPARPGRRRPPAQRVR
ncbi:SURF1 family protein [Nocardioides sp. AE5]|uniref:SURF1 family cytochrome oxidase biogenesis protein n=1 Tax=Nocardioides sp. AE5 TaxID=2962573 RepID=UPI0028825E78|nr:SURF1 family protein [Nocardioides sp. AE5]MDT0203616.1 SURF1 family protein [Nocardioides sp. AE5]